MLAWLFNAPSAALSWVYGTQTAVETRALTRELAGSATATRSAIRMFDAEGHPKIHGAFDTSLTLYTALMRRKELDPSGSGRMFGTRKPDPATGNVGAFEWVTFREFLADVDALASGMRHPSIGLKRTDIVGVFSKNRYEWSVVEHSCNRMTFTLVPLYDTLGPAAVPYILNETEMPVVFCAKPQFETLMSCIHECHHIKTVVQFEAIDDAERALAAAKNVQLVTFADVMALGKAHPLAADPPLPSDISTICYTSGTTGNPKGAVLTQSNVASIVDAWHAIDILPTDVHISYLPLAHVFERAVHAVLLSKGGAIGFYQGDVTKLLDDIAALQPTLLFSVPRVLNRIFGKITQGVKDAGGVKAYVFQWALAVKQQQLQTHGTYTHALWDALVFRKVQALLGGRVRVIMSGSAPLSAEVKEFLAAVFGCPVIEGYGLTEASAGVSCSVDSMAPAANTGPPLAYVQVRLEDVPDMNYTTKDAPFPRGEILVRGPCVFQGYYKQPKLTAEVIDADGWLHTGDIGAWTADGFLRIVDRKKNLFKLSQGEYVAPEKVEGIYIKSAFVAEVFVHGDSLQNFAVGVVVPDADVVAKWAAQQGLTGDAAALAALCASGSDLHRAIMADLQDLATANKLFRFEQIQKLCLHPSSFADDGLVTPTFKLKRPQLAAFFAKQIREMYAADSDTPNA